MRLLAALYLLSVASYASAANVTYTFGESSLAATIPDADLSGYQRTVLVSGFDGLITDVNFSFNVSGGFNGDFYGFLTHGSATAILINRAGRSTLVSAGYPEGGYAVKLDDQASSDVHTYRAGAFTLSGGQLIGSWQPDGRAIDPLSPGSVFSSAPRSGMLNVFNGIDPNGPWTFFLADVAGGSQGVLNSYSLEITAVPEPSCLVFVGLALLLVRKKSWLAA